MSDTQWPDLNKRQLQLIGLSSTCLGLSTLAVVLRLVIRWSSTAILWWDDWIIVLALVVSWLPNILTISAIKYGLGRHIVNVDQSNITTFGVIVFTNQIAWGVSTGLIIFSILLFYFRLFPNTWMRKAVYIIGTWDAAWTICTLIVTVNQCIPIHYVWNHEPYNAKCIDINAFYFSSGLFSTLTILTVLFLPLPIVSKLQVSSTKKLGLTISFTVGAFTCIASVVRMISLLRTDGEDLTYSLTYPALWSCIEVSFGVISACLPSLTTLFLTLLGKGPSKSRSHSLSLNRKRATTARHADFNGSAGTTDRDAQAQNSGLVTGNYYAMDNLNFAHESAGSILVTQRVDQVTSPKTNQTSQAEEVGVVADASTWSI